MALTTGSPELATMIAAIETKQGHGIPNSLRVLCNAFRADVAAVGAAQAFANFAASLARTGDAPSPARDAANVYVNGGGTLVAFIKALANSGGLSYLIRDAAQACLTATGTAN